MRFLFVIFLAVCSGLRAQQADLLLFKEKIHDFGEITEDGGNADVEFTFLNNSGRTMKIISVKASCGCTTPGWTKDPIPQGKEGFVKASFNPKGRPGFFSKSLTVTTDLEGSPLVLQIKGQVASKTRGVTPTDYPVERGSLRFKSNSFNVDKIFINTGPSLREFPVYNPSDKPIHFTANNIGPRYITIKTPRELGPRERGVIKIIYDARLRNQYGFTSDDIEIGTDDEKQPMKSFSVYATIEESFSVLSAEELSKAPVFQLEATEIDVGGVRQGTVLDRVLAVKNPGKKDLIIRAIQENCSCVKASIDPMRIKAGQAGKVRISLNTQGRIGVQQKAVTIYTNDPSNPVQRITVLAYVQE